MFEQRRVSQETNPEFLRNTNGLVYTTGNVTVDVSGMDANDVIEPGTALHYNATSELYEVVSEPAEGEENALLDRPVLTRDRVVVKDPTKPVHVSAIEGGSPTEALCHNVTEQFKRSNGRFFWY